MAITAVRANAAGSADGADGRRVVPRGALDPRAPTPLYHQIYVVLREKILNGAYRAGTRLPGEQGLASDFGVSRITTKRAVNELAAEGLVVRERGRGTKVSFTMPQRLDAGIGGLLENLMAMGLETEARVLDFAYEVPPAEIGRALEVAADAKVQRAVRVRYLDGEPFSYLTTYVPAEFGRHFGRAELARTPLLALLERGGVEVTVAAQTITATLADTVVAPALEVKVGSPLLGLTRVVRDQNDRPVEHINALYRPDRYQYRMRLSRVQGEEHNRWSPTE